MKIGAILIGILLACAGCGDTVSVENTEASLFIRVAGSQALPYVEVKSGEPADAVLRFTAVHVRSNKKAQSDVRLKKLATTEWEKRSNTVIAEADVGVLVSVSFTDEKDERTVIDDHSEVVVPFLKDQKRSDGPITYEAVWSQKG